MPKQALHRSSRSFQVICLAGENAGFILITILHDNHLPIDEARFREVESSYDEAQTLCDPGWQSQPTIDHNLYTKYLEIRRLTLTKHLLYYNTIVLHKSTQHTLSLWLS